MGYYAITVTLENITGITAVKDKYGTQTQGVTFNVTVAGKRHYAVVMRGNPRLENGTVVTAVLREPENWQTLVAWLNHTTGQICGIDSPGQHLMKLLFSAFIATLFVLKAAGEHTGTGFAVVLLSLAAIINAWSLASLRKSVKVYRLLKP